MSIDEFDLFLASQDRPISRKELGIQAQNTNDGLKTLCEGFFCTRLQEESEDGVKPAEVISKDDMITILTDIQLYFRELTKNKYDMQILYEKAEEFEADFNCFINTKIYELSKGTNNKRGEINER